MKPRTLPTPTKLKSFLLGGAALCLGMSFSAAKETLVRDWKSEDGKYEVRASLTGFNQSTKRVTLQKEDSSTVKVPLKKLSAADQAYIVAQAPKLSQKGEAGETTRLFGITWQNEIEDALAEATGSSTSSDDRPVMWFRVLGELDGGM